MEFITLVIYLSMFIGIFALVFYVLSFIEGNKRKRLFYSDFELPKVSVIIPAYNEEETIERTLLSITKSDYPDFEVLVIDDGSKDRTLEIAKKFEGKYIRVFHKENGGKGTALNFGIKHAQGKIIFSMDADTTVAPQSMKNMVRYFKEQEVMSVTPAMVIDNPRSVLQRVQSIEYLAGLFLRKSFASLKSIYISPGAFSAYRKSFFDKYGSYDEKNITEDLEMALRIQSLNYVTENCPDAPAYTIAPSRFKELLIQRRRWYFGLIKNLLNYKKIISRKYGDLGSFVIPIAIVSVFFAIFITTYFFFKILFEVKKEILFLNGINFDFGNMVNFNFHIVERFLFQLFSNPVVLFVIFFMFVLIAYLRYALKKLDRSVKFILDVPLFLLFFSVLFSLWWIVSIVYSFFYQEIKWR